MSLYDDSFKEHIKRIRYFKPLSETEEIILAKEWREKHNSQALEQLIEAHLKLVAKLAMGYRGYGLPISDIIAEGHVGIMQAARHYDPEKGFRFSTYAGWWIRATIHEYILKMWSIVDMGTKKSHRKLFFKFRRELEREEKLGKDTSEIIKSISKTLDVSEDDVVYIKERLQGRDQSLNTPAPESQREWIDWLEDEHENQEITLVHRQEFVKRKELFEKALKSLNQREHEIFIERRLKEPPMTLEGLSQKLNISRERVRQIEIKSFEKVQKEVRRLTSTDKRISEVFPYVFIISFYGDQGAFLPIWNG